MKILVVTNMYPFDGDEHYGIFVREHVDALVAEGVDVDVIFVNGKEVKSNYLTEIPRLARALGSGRYDVVHVQHSYCVMQVTLLRRLLRVRTPVVFTMHEGEAHSAAGSAGKGAGVVKRLVYWKRLKRWALEMSDYVVAVEAKMVKVVGYRGSSSVIQPAVDTDLFRPMDRKMCRQMLGLPADEQIVFFPASASRPEKGAETLKESLPLVKGRLHVVYGGDIQRGDMPVYMNAADVVVQTSYFEASPMVIKEALACDRPVVSTDVGDVRTLFGDVGGCFCTSQEPEEIARAIEDALGLVGSVEGRDRVLGYGLSRSSVAKRYKEIYRGLAAAGGPARGGSK